MLRRIWNFCDLFILLKSEYFVMVDVSNFVAIQFLPLLFAGCPSEICQWESSLGLPPGALTVSLAGSNLDSRKLSWLSSSKQIRFTANRTEKANLNQVK